MMNDVIFIAALLMLSAFFSFSETAFTSVQRIKLKYKADGGSKKAKTALAILEQYEKSLSSFLIGNNVVNILLTAVATVLILDLLPENAAENYGVLITTVVVTFLTLTFGDILPKTIARIKAESFCLMFGGFLRLYIFVLTPISVIFLSMQNLITKILTRGAEKTVSVTEQELMHIIDEIKEEGVLEERESKLVKNALDFDETSAAKIITPRVDITAVPADEDITKVRDLFFSSGHSRIPVYENTIDNIVGMLNSKEFMRRIISEENVSIREIMHEPLYITGTAKISEVFRHMQREHQQLVVVLDEYGGTAGIVTLRDILEELVGEIWDEADVIEQ
jgi:CBS domain containing-hemolysin-like protein